MAAAPRPDGGPSNADADNPPIDPDTDFDNGSGTRDGGDGLRSGAVRDRRPATGLGAGRRPWSPPPAAFVAAVFVGGCVGGLARYELSRAWPSGPHGFPWTVLVINTSGALALAGLLALLADAPRSAGWLRPLLGTGFCGAWTTFSSIVASTDQLLADGRPGTGILYLASSIATGLAAAVLGLALGRRLAGHRPPRDTGAARPARRFSKRRRSA